MTSLPTGPALLFCPADRTDRYAKAAQRADAVILDLEDAVAPDAKDAARRALVTGPALDPARTIVRVNAVGTADLAADLEALASTPYRVVMLAKASSASDVAALQGHDVVALVETPVGVLRVAEIAAAPNVVGLMWGAEDLLAALGGTSSRSPGGGYRDVAVHARSAVLLAARAHGKAAIDAVHLDLDDLDGLAAEAADAAASGFTATACLHPAQVPVVREAYRPSADEVAWARGVIEAARHERGVFRWDGRMVDEPVLRHAAELVRRAERLGARA
ncbi:HpcH/HpaI aldolase/citrate lyase family protein [Cellulomonas alba]|uniref:CoA ester lyase n=1 Tax=Cellulomonas alba TaxID=3053467 RepID=A0ABT7SL68_9CELL|nr:CoA ester lyase [Cellulomonas alba]MDM7856274.1 CoA ester lyase [Cellulomonas alba]